MKQRRRLACRFVGGPPAYLLLVLFFAASALAHPGIGIVMDSRGNVFYTDLKHVWKIAPDGTKSIAVRNVHTHELSIDAEDNLFGEHLWYEGDATRKWGHRVWRLDRVGKLTDVIPAREGFLSNYSFVRDRAGNMYWVDRDRDNTLMKRAPDGSLSSIARKAGVRDVRWLTVTPEGTVYLIDLLDIRRITPQGRINTIARNLVSCVVNTSSFAGAPAGEIKAREGGDAEASPTTSNAEIARQSPSPEGCPPTARAVCRAREP